MKILVTGKNGQLGCEINKLSKKNNFNWLFLDIDTFDLFNLDNIINFLENSSPDIIINCAAYTSVEGAEDDFETAITINHRAVKLIAKWTYINNCRLIHISTDYVYDGMSLIPYVETDKENPLNNYGKSKLLGDIECQKNNPTSIIIRTSSLYSSFGNNFVKNIIDLLENNDEVKVISDQVSSPTYAADLANIILFLIENKLWYSGVYNYTNSGEISWYDFANEIKDIYGFKSDIKPILTKEFNQKAIRPKYSVLDNSKIKNTFGISQIDYKDSLRNCIKIIKDGS